VSAKANQIYDKFHHQLDTIEGRLQSVKTNMKAMPEQAEKALRDKLDEAKSRIQAQKKSIEQTRADLKARAEQKVSETKEAVSEWKAKHETRKLNARADRAEDYAADAVEFAMAGIDEAEEAILEAVVARIDAEAAQ
jgi:hypothetical protein